MIRSISLPISFEFPVVEVECLLPFIGYTVDMGWERVQPQQQLMIIKIFSGILYEFGIHCINVLFSFVCLCIYLCCL